MGTGNRGSIGHGHGGTLLGISDADGGGIDGEHAALVGQRDGHVAREVSTQHVEGCGDRLAHIGAEGQRLVLNNQFGSGSNGLVEQRHLLGVGAGGGSVGVVGDYIEVVGCASRQVLDGVGLGGNARDHTAALVTALAHGLGYRAIVDIHAVQVVALLAAGAGNGYLLACGSGYAAQRHAIVGSGIGQRYGLTDVSA